MSRRMKDRDVEMYAAGYQAAVDDIATWLEASWRLSPRFVWNGIWIDKLRDRFTGCTPLPNDGIPGIDPPRIPPTPPLAKNAIRSRP